MSIELYFQIVHGEEYHCKKNIDISILQDYWTGKSKNIIELPWSSIIISTDFFNVISDSNSYSLGQIIQLQKNYEIGKYALKMNKFIRLLKEINKLAQFPPWTISKDLRLVKGQKHPDAEKYSLLYRWLLLHELCSETVYVEFYQDTSGYGRDSPKYFELDL